MDKYHFVSVLMVALDIEIREAHMLAYEVIHKYGDMDGKVAHNDVHRAMLYAKHLRSLA